MAYAANMGYGTVIINSNEAKRDGDDSPKAMGKYAKKEDYTAPYLIDVNSAMADAFGGTLLPGPSTISTCYGFLLWIVL